MRSKSNSPPRQTCQDFRQRRPCPLVPQTIMSFIAGTPTNRIEAAVADGQAGMPTVRNARLGIPKAPSCGSRWCSVAWPSRRLAPRQRRCRGRNSSIDLRSARRHRRSDHRRLSRRLLIEKQSAIGIRMLEALTRCNRMPRDARHVASHADHGQSSIAGRGLRDPHCVNAT